MEFFTTAWERYGSGTTDRSGEYSLLEGSGRSSLDGQSNASLESQESRPAKETPLISWQTTPSFEVSVNVYEIWRLGIPILLSLVPSFLRPRRGHRKITGTSYLDGLRGIAALIVVFHHYSINFTATALDGWHSGEPGSHDWFFLFPLVRVLHSGRFMVIIFFVISGYVLSYRGLKLAREGKKEQLLDSLASSVFRRWIRLHLPVVASTFIGFLLARGAVWTILRPNWDHLSEGAIATRAQNSMPLPYPEGTFTQQFWDWFADAKQLCDPFRFGAYSNSKYNINNLWTIPIEWMGSMIVFIVVLGISRAKTWAKIGTLLILIYWAHRNARWEWGTFLSGTLLAEMALIRTSYLKPTSDHSWNEKIGEIAVVSTTIKVLSRTFWLVVFVVGIYLGAQPQQLSSTSPGYMTLMSWLPPQYQGNPDIFYPCMGGVLVLFSLENCPWLQTPFLSPFAQYLGDISFSLYMLHGQVLSTLGQWIIPKCMDITGGWENGGFGFGCGMALAALVCGPVTAWVSDLFWRGVDDRSVKFARWVGEKCFIKDA